MKKILVNKITELRKEKGMIQLGLADKIFKGVALALGISDTVLLILNQIELRDALILLGIGLSSLAISLLDNTK